jgi:hypothetical protein
MVGEEDFLDCLDYSEDESDNQQIWSVPGGLHSESVSDMSFSAPKMVGGDVVVPCPNPRSQTGDLGQGVVLSSTEPRFRGVGAGSGSHRYHLW